MKKIVPFILPLVAVATIAIPVTARQTSVRATVTGVVLDTVSNRPIPFAVVSIAGTGVSTLTNRQGRFRLMFDPADVELQIRKIGYRRGSVTMRVTGDTTLADVFLDPIPFELEAITVTAEGEDPGMQIMRRAIAQKRDLLDRIHDYRYDAYVKFVIRDLDKDPDSTKSIVMLTESQTSAYWEQPDRYQETITARQQSTNLDADNNLISVGQIVNFNKNRVDMQKYSVVSPAADDALDHYRYRLLDTLHLDGRTVFRLAILPRSDVSPLFVGMVDVADSTFDILAIDVGANDAVRFDFLENLRYAQRMRDMGDGYWMPDEIRFSGELHFGVPIPGFPEHLSFEHIASLRNYEFDGGDPPATLGEYIVVVDEDADERETHDWEARRTSALTDVESSAYRRIDSLESQATPLGTKLLSGVANLALTNTVDFYHFNRVEGNYIGAGGTFRDVSPDWVLRARGGHAFGSETWQYRLGAQHRLVEARRLWLGASYGDEIVPRPTMISAGRNSSNLALLAKLDPLDYYAQRGFVAFLSTKLMDFTQIRLQYNDFDHSSVTVASDYSLFNGDKLQRDNPPITEGRFRSWSASLTYDSRPLLKSKGRDFFFGTLIYTRVTLAAEFASPSLLANDFDFRRYSLRLRRRQRTLNMGITTIDAVAGTSGGTLPPQRHFTVDFGNGAFFQSSGFNTLNETNFTGDRAAMFFVSHDFDQQLLRRSRVPLLRDLPVTLSVHGGAFWTNFAGTANRPANILTPTAPTAYGELGFGVGNLTPFIAPFNFTAWFTWQLSSYDTDRFAFAIGIPAQ